MAKVILDVNDKELDNLLVILNSLKQGIINKIDIDKKRNYNKAKPISNEPLKPINLQGKYVDPQTFKERLRKMRQK
jgi:hypothetical protein